MNGFALAVTAALCLHVAAAPGAPKAAKGKVVRLWPGAPATAPAGKAERRDVVPRKAGRTITKVTNVTDPTITIVRPKGAAEATPAVVICPGGGYGILAWDLEGTEIAEWLNSLGVTGIVLKYRVPRQRDAAFQDAQRAVSLVRHRAGEWGIDPHKIGILGFSAGGHLAARLCTNHRKRAYEPRDDADRVSCRPDFAVLIYPAYLATKDGAALDTATLPVAADTPSTFLAIACGDRFTPGAVRYFLALRKAKVRSELHVFQFGGHGCGLRKADANVTTWPAHCARWMAGLGVVTGGKIGAGRSR